MIILKSIPSDIYTDYEKRVIRLPLTQSSVFGGDLYFGVMQNDQAIGLCMINEHRVLNGLIQAVTLDRGPVWFDGYDTPENNTAFAYALNELYPKRIGRKRRWIQESEHTQDHHWKRRSDGYQTSWLDITRSPETIRAAFKKNWRGALKKAENSPIEIIWDDDLSALPFILKTYDLDKKRRGYGGLNVYDLERYVHQWHDMDALMIGRVMHDGNTIAYGVIVTHGNSATYQCGWTHALGRQHNAHHFLLWRAIHMLQQNGVMHFDLGGINDENSGLAKFKLGMGGGVHCGAGLYT